MRSLLIVAFCLFLSCTAFSQTIYYSKATGNLNVLSTWGINTNGSGTSPTNFTSNNCIYTVVNNVAATLGGNWTVSGTNSKIVVGNGTQAINFTIPSANSVTGTVDVANTSTLSILSISNPTFGTLSSGSTVAYARAGNQTITNTTYHNLSISGSGSKTLAITANTTVNGVLTLTAGLSLTIGNSVTVALVLNGTITGGGTLTGGNNCNLTIGGTGSLGNITFSAANEILNNFVINRTGAGTLGLGSVLTVRTNLTHTNGVLSLNTSTLTLNGANTFPVALANGSFSGSVSAALLLAGTSYTNSIKFNTGSQTIKDLTFNSSGVTIALGSNLTVSGAFVHSRGILNLNGNTLSLTGTANLSNNTALGTVTGSATSGLSFSVTSISNRLFMTAGAETLNTLTMNSSGQTLILGTNLTVSGTLTHSAGILSLNGRSLTLSGPLVLPASAANGSISSTNTSTLNISATSITNNLYFTTGGQALGRFSFNSPGATLGMGTALTLSGVFIHTAGNLSLNATNFTANAAITFPANASTGSFIGSSTSTLTIGGAGAITGSMYFSQSGTGNYMSAVTLNRVGQTLTAGNILNIVGVLTPTAGTFASAGNLVLLATASTNVGRIGTIGGSVTGNITAHMYAKGGSTGWTLLGAPGISGRTFSDWDDDMGITCSSCPDGFMASFTSIYSYLETVGGLFDNQLRYIPITTITTGMTAGTGYWVYLGNATSTSTDMILDVTGPVNQGNKTFNLTLTSSGGGTLATDHGYNLVANPYPSPISWTALRNANANVADAIHVYNPDISGHATCVGGISSPAVGSGGIGNNIPIGQAFYVKANAAATLTGQETNKGASTQELLKTGAQQTQAVANPVLMRLKVNGHAMQFETAFYFETKATVNFDDEYDAGYWGPDLGYLGICTQLNGSNYAINGMPALIQNYSIPVRVHTDSNDVYTISAFDMQSIPAGACINLHDNYTGADQDLRTGNYTCAISDTEKVAARFVLNITIDPSLNVTGSFVNPSCSNATDGMLIASASGTGPWNYFWKDVNTIIVKTSLNKSGADTLLNLGPGVFSVDVNTAGSCDNGTASFTLNSLNAPQAGFTPLASTVTFISDSIGVTFTNTSVNALAYWWDFGDGMGSVCFDTTHQYTSPGQYTVTLAAIGPCGDTTYYSQLITVIDGSAVGIADIAQPSEHMFISRDVNGFYVQFTGKENTGAHISVQNILGEKVIADQYIPHASHQKAYIPFGDTNDKILIISVVTDSGEKTYCKIINY